MAKKLEERVARLEKALKLGPFPGTEPRKEEEPFVPASIVPASRGFAKAKKKTR